MPSALMQMDTEIAEWIRSMGFNSLDRTDCPPALFHWQGKIVELPRFTRIHWIDGKAYHRMRVVDVVPDLLLQADQPEPRQIAPEAASWLTLAEAAELVGLEPRSLLKRIGKRINWAQCGRLPGKQPRFNRTKFVTWWESDANRPPPRTAANRQPAKKQRR